MSHARPEPEIPSRKDAYVPSPRDSEQDREGAERSPAPREGPTRPQRLPRLVTAVVFGLLCLAGFAIMVNGLLGAALVFFGEAVLSALILTVVGVIGFWVLRRIRPVRPPSTTYSLLALLWGMTAAVGLALIANGNLMTIWNTLGGLPFGEAWGAALSAPVNEELLKVTGVVLIAVMAPHVLRGPVDGFVIGALVGLGFQLVEDFTYTMNVIPMVGGIDGPASVLQTLLVRVGLTGLGSHWAMTAVAGTAVGLMVAASWRPGRRHGLRAALLLLVAMGVHWFFDSPIIEGIVGTVLKSLLVFLVAMIVYFVVRHTHRSRVRRVLAEEGEELGMRRSAAMALANRHGRRGELRRAAYPERPAVARRQERLVDFAEDRAFEYRVPFRE